MSRMVSRFCLRQITVCCLVCSVFLVLVVKRPSLNDYVLTVLKNVPQTELAAELRQLERKSLIQDKCRDTITNVQFKQSKQKVVTPVMFKIEERHRIMYCDVPKVASTNLKRLMLILSGAVETNDLSFIPSINAHSKNPMQTFFANNLNDTLKNGVGNFTKFMFVRHPLERLVSAYQDRLASNNTRYHNIVGKRVIRKYRKNPSPLSLKTGDDVTFPEFVSFVIDEWKVGKRPLDPHWRPVVDLCLPCEMQFDFIGKFETLNHDVEFLLRKLNESDLSRLFAIQPKPKTTSTLWKEFINKISYQQLIHLNRMFADDFRLFGYPHYYVGREPLQH